MNLFRSLSPIGRIKAFIEVIVVMLVMAIAFSPAQSQTYAVNNPTYIPTAILAPSTFTTSGTATFNNNGNGTVLIRVAGTNTGLSAVVQITESRVASPTWTTVPVQTVGGTITSTITANGLYRLNVNGAAQVRFNLSSITGTNVTVSAAGTPGAEFTQQLPASQATYSAAATITPASSATDFFTLTGSASKTIRVTRAACSGTAASAATGTLVAVKRSAANTGGTTSAATATALDSGNAAAAATALTYSANPTTGTLVGNLRSAFIVMTPTTSAIGVQPVAWEFGMRPGEQPVVLRGVAQVFALNGGGASFPGSSSLACNVTWTEE